MLQYEEAKILLGLGPDAIPSPSQVKAAYRRKAGETHPDRFPAHQKAQAELKFKSVSEAYTFLSSGGEKPAKCTSSVVFVGREDGRKKSTRRRRTTKKCETCFGSFPCDHFGCSYTWWIDCFQGLPEAAGGTTFLQSVSPLRTGPGF